MRRPRVYAAHPMTTYGTHHEAECLAAIAGLLPGVELLNPAEMFTSSGHWLDRWPDVLDTLDGLALFTGEYAVVGTGCLREVNDAVVHGIPLAVLDHGRHQLCDLARLDFLPYDLRSRATTARVITGPPLRWTVTDGELVEEPVPAACAAAPLPRMPQSDAPYCSTCGDAMRRSGSCHVCGSCGSTSGCS